MVRPTIDDEVVERLTDAVDARTKVPAEHLGIGERLAFVLDELEEADKRAARLEDRVDTLEAELDEARQQRDDTGVPTNPNDLDLNVGDNRGGSRGPF
jgi:chromosome segregation ATPase